MKTLARFEPVSHQQMEDVEEYNEFWATNHHVWVLVIPFLIVGAMVLAVALFL